jgi:hypothetical protein
MKVIDKLNSGKLDIVGDVHGEVAALEQLLGKLGYENGVHPDGRKLVFVGDLVDRGPDSPTVVERVMSLVESGTAQCIIGNHELNILLGECKDGNEWFFEPDSKAASDMQPIRRGQKRAFLEFFAGLPLALENDELRIVHACWHEESLEKLSAEDLSGQSIKSVHNRYKKVIDQDLKQRGVFASCEQEDKRYGRKVRYGKKDPWRHWPEPVMLDAHSERDVARQTGNPIKVLTSGVERQAIKPFPASGKFRFADRVRWWDEYTDDKTVIVGHYWRKFLEVRDDIEKDLPPDLFEGIDPDQWMGLGHNVYCVDFSVGLAAQKRRKGEATDSCRLAALRWPEQVVMFDDGSVKPLVRRWSPDRYRKAWNFACRFHEGQKVPGTEIGYANHLGSVAMEVIGCLDRSHDFCNPDLAVQCALLHDSIEDANIRYEWLVSEFGRCVADGVRALTKDPTCGDKLAQMRDSLLRIKQQPREVWIVKLADRITNLQPPPKHWSKPKIEQYREEAALIRDELGAASKYLRERLNQKIRNYP